MSAVREREAATHCPVCTQGRLVPFLDAGWVPVHVGTLRHSPEEALDAPRGRMVPGACSRCGLVFNLGFDAALVDYEGEYDNALHFSAVFRQFELGLAERLIERYALRGGHVVEIGCGSGHFLGLLCERGANVGLGYDPSHDPERVDPLARGRVQFVKEPFDRASRPERADLVCMRHVLEHIPSPLETLESIRRVLDGSPDAVFYCEVPNGLFVFRRRSIWDLMYEHCSYFVPATLAYLVESAGFEVLALDEVYAGQFLSVEARPATRATRARLPDASELAELAEDLRSFAAHFQTNRDHWRSRLAELVETGGRAVVWGAGGKTVQFSSLVGEGAPIDYVVDVNPGKQGTFLNGSGWPVRAPDALRLCPPQLVIIANPIYESEIRAALVDLGVRSDVALLR